MKRTLALAVACALVLEGCGESDAPGEARKKTVLEYASMKDIRNINPHLYLGEMAAQAMVFEPLVFNTPEGVKPALAERWEISGDGRTYTFHLRRGVKFTDGTPFTADAVKKNIDAVMANRTRHAWLDMINSRAKWSTSTPGACISGIRTSPHSSSSGSRALSASSRPPA